MGKDVYANGNAIAAKVGGGKVITAEMQHGLMIGQGASNG